MSRRPRRFGEFIGQRPLITMVSALVAGAKQLGEPVMPLLLVGRAGFGKSTLARAIAHEIGTSVIDVYAGPDLKPPAFCELLLRLNVHDVLFVDEAHSLSTPTREILMLALDERRCPKPANRSLDRAETASLPPFSAIIATNQPGELSEALRSRLKEVAFSPYSTLELIEIVRRVADLDGLTLTAQAARRIAEVSEGSPRLAEQWIKLLHQLHPSITHFEKPIVDDMLELDGRDERGFSLKQRVCLDFLSSVASASVERLAGHLGTDARYVAHAIEPALLKAGLIEIGVGGRRLTPLGRLALASRASSAVSATPEETGKEAGK